MEKPSERIKELTNFEGVATDEEGNYVFKEGQWEEIKILAIIKYLDENQPKKDENVGKTESSNLTNTHTT